MDWGTILTTSIAVLGITATIVLSLKLRKNKEPVWAYKTSKIIGIGTNAPKELKLTFDGKPVNEVYQTIVMILNKGKETIRRDDMTQNITILFTGADILREPTIESISREAIEFSAKQVINETGQHTVQLDFRYLDHNDGAVIKVIHTRSGQIECVGNIIGAKRIIGIGKIIEGYPPSGIRLFSLLILAIVIVCVSALIIFGVLPFVPESKPWVESIVFVVAGMGLGLISSLVAWVLRYAHFKKFPRWTIGVQEDISRLVAKGFDLKAYCMQCRSRKRIKNPEFYTLKNGRPAVQGVCPDCGTKLFRIGVTAPDDL